MIPRKGRTLLTDARDQESRDYRTQNARRRVGLNNYPFLRTGRKSTAVRSAVGVFGAGVERRRASRSNTITMDATTRPTTGPTFNQWCPGCPGGVPAGPPFSRDTTNSGQRVSNRRFLYQASGVSRVSWVILKTIAGGGVSAHMRPVSGISNQTGHPGHLTVLTMLSRSRKPNSPVAGVPSESRTPGTPPGHPGHPGGDRDGC